MSTTVTWPRIIQGGMGVGVSGWQLANAVARCGALGVVSGTAVDTTLVRRLQDGDAGGHLRRAMAAFPIPHVSDEVMRKYFREGGRAPGRPYVSLPMYKQRVNVARQQLTVLASFVEVFLAKEGHDHPVGINLLTKLQLPNLALLYGAMLAGVDYVLMGAGIPREIPGALDALAAQQPASLRFDVEGDTTNTARFISFSPEEIGADVTSPLVRPKFIAIVASHTLAITLARKSTGRVDGFIVEGPTAGGHNAPARGALTLNENGEPIYGERDVVDLQPIRELGAPFWLAGGTGSPEQLEHALQQGAAGIQVGTLFAYCDESGFEPTLRESVLEAARHGDIKVFTDPRASPTGYPFKVVHTATTQPTFERERVCDLGYLRTAYLRPDAKIDYRCPAEPIEHYLRKGGKLEDTVGRQCVCNGLISAVGLPQIRAGDRVEPPLVTSGNALLSLQEFLGAHRHYSASDAVAYLLRGDSGQAHDMNWSSPNLR